MFLSWYVVINMIINNNVSKIGGRCSLLLLFCMCVKQHSGKCIILTKVIISWTLGMLWACSHERVNERRKMGKFILTGLPYVFQKESIHNFWIQAHFIIIPWFEGFVKQWTPLMLKVLECILWLDFYIFRE